MEKILMLNVGVTLGEAASTLLRCGIWNIGSGYVMIADTGTVWFSAGNELKLADLIPLNRGYWYCLVSAGN
jgi:hypothetical protein